jgi:alpha-glucosidase
MATRWEDAVVYQIYPRSFQDSNGDGIGDLEGIRSRLDHLVDLGVDAFWLSPIYPSPDADWGYDISDHTAIHPDFGTLADFDALVDDAHARGLGVVLDLVPNHTSIEHPWFREHPDRYVWADDIPNNWRSVFGGPAWSRDELTSRFYLHSFHRLQPDLDWRNPAVPEALDDVMRFWLGRGVDGFRVDAVERISKDPELRDDPPAQEPFALPLPEGYADLHHLHSRNAPGIEPLLEQLRHGAGDAFLVGEVYLPAAELDPFLERLDAAFAFELMFSEWGAEPVAEVLGRARSGLAWTLSNHDFSRLATRLGEENVRLAATLQLTLPGPAFIYQGDELGLGDGPGADPPHDSQGRDVARHAMQWEPGPLGGFTTGEPWLAPVDPDVRNAADQRRDPASVLSLYRQLIALRRELAPGFELLDADDSLVLYRRGGHVVMLNFGEADRSAPVRGEPVFSTHAAAEGHVPAHGAVVVAER